jgi:hypothetical protein
MSQNPNVQNQSETTETQSINTSNADEIDTKQQSYEDSDKLSDEERVKIVSSLE